MKTKSLTNAQAFNIGAESDGGNPTDAQIDDVRIYNYALTIQQIKLLFNGDAAVRFGPETGSP